MSEDVAPNHGDESQVREIEARPLRYREGAEAGDRHLSQQPGYLAIVRAQDGHQPACAQAWQAHSVCRRKIQTRDVGARVDECSSRYRLGIQAQGSSLPPQIRRELDLDFDNGRKVLSKFDSQHAEGRTVLVTIGIATSFTAGSPAFKTR